MTAAGLLFGKAFGLLARVPIWAWALAAALAWGGVGRLELKHERAARTKERAAQASAIASQQARAKATEIEWKGKYDAIKIDKTAQLVATAAARDAALAELRKRGPRRTDVPGAAIDSCAGSTGAELAGPDAGFLARYAAIARGFQLELGACQAREAVRAVNP